MTNTSRRRLILSRHAKSSWDDPATEDHDRPLNARGQRATRELGDWLASRGYLPEEVLCSTALRTAETWAGIAATPLEVLSDLRLMPELYNASPDEMLDALKTATADTVMIIGHNPGIAAFAAGLCAVQPQDPEFRRYPTGATLVLDFDAPDWTEIDAGSGRVLDFYIPPDAS